VKTNYKYYLANGACIEYALSPDSNLVTVIDRIVCDYFAATNLNAPDTIWVSPAIAHAIGKEVADTRGCSVTAVGAHCIDFGWNTLRLQTVLGPVTVVTKFGMDWPIFMGSEQELKDNSFNASMEKILCE
jgi:hypothetical protein